MDSLIRDFLNDCELRDLGPETITNYRSNIKIFYQFLGKKNVNPEDVDGTVLKDFLQYLRNERKNSQKRASNYFSALSSFYDYLVTENIVKGNPVPPIRKRYLRGYKKETINGQRKAISVEEMSMLINSILDLQYKAIVTLFAKTGVRRGESIRIDIDDINFKEMFITLKPCRKRSSLKVIFDDECARVLQQWIYRREQMYGNTKEKALFISKKKTRLQRAQITRRINNYAARVGLHDPSSNHLDDRFSPHCCRHWFTTHLIRNGMPREYVKELRGDARKDAIDLYNHIDFDDLRNKYLACIPQLGI